MAFTVGDKVTTTIETFNGRPYPHYGRVMTVESMDTSDSTAPNDYVIVSLDNFNVNHPEHNNRYRYKQQDLAAVE